MNPLINPLARNGKFGWYDTFRKHITMSQLSTNVKLMLIGNSIIANFDKCRDIFHKFFLPFHTLNFGISWDKIQNTLWRVCNMTLPASVEYVIIDCGTNNLGHNSPLKIAEGLINIACMLRKNYKNLHIFVSCLLPRDKLFWGDDLHLNRKRYEKLPELFICKIESFKLHFDIVI